MTADQVAHAIIAASKIMNVNPIMVAKGMFARNTHPGRKERARARSYAALALADVFGNDDRASRVLGMTSSGVATLRWQLSKGALKWFDRRALAKVKEAIPDKPAGEAQERAKPEGAIALPPATENARSAPAVAVPAVPTTKKTPELCHRGRDATVAGMGLKRPFSRDLIGEKAGLRDELRRAIETTAKMPSQN